MILLIRSQKEVRSVVEKNPNHQETVGRNMEVKVTAIEGLEGNEERAIRNYRGKEILVI